MLNAPLVSHRRHRLRCIRFNVHRINVAPRPPSEVYLLVLRVPLVFGVTNGGALRLTLLIVGIRLVRNLGLKPSVCGTKWVRALLLIVIG